MSLSFHNVLILSVLIRITLICYGEWHDAHSIVKYTDIDYRVFSDAARFVWSGGGDPYMRETYRYTPLLALLLTPNEFIHPSFGKCLFALCDIINGVFIYNMLSGKNPKIYSAIHLLNPMVFSISTRGSSESVLCFFVLSTLYAAQKDRWDVAAVLLGVSTHWKIYPVIYASSCLAVIGHGKFITLSMVRFATISAGTFFVLGGLCYSIWGYPFLYESYLYHLHRLDHRHNFSPYFYLTYITYPTSSSALSTSLFRSPLTSFVPQMFLAITSGFVLTRTKHDLPLAWFVQTAVFVIFNKVCTSQYFLWYLLLLPLLLPHLKMSMRRACICISVWILVQALWLAEAYRLEFLGLDVFFSLWVRSLLYVVGNGWVLGQILDSYIL